MHHFFDFNDPSPLNVSQVFRHGRSCYGKRATMAVSTAVLLGVVLAGMAGFRSCSTLKMLWANRLAVLYADGALGGLARSNEARSSFRRAPSRDNGPRRLEPATNHPPADAVLPRILTVLTTYSRRSALVKEYKEAVLDRQDGYHPTVK